METLKLKSKMLSPLQNSELMACIYYTIDVVKLNSSTQENIFHSIEKSFL